jgi:cell division protein FtsN
MDQKTSNDADKRNWRERLGISTKDLPRISEEFARPKEPVLMEQAPKPKAAPIVVAKPAPMAPRVPPKSVEPPPQAPSAPQGRPMQPAPPQSSDVLAERLRNQRVAAEKLAEQRVSAARERAEANKTATAQAPPAQPRAPQQMPPNADPPQQSGKSKPKFSFSDEELRAEPKRETRPVPPQMRPAAQRPTVQQPMQPQLTPPRPSLGGERQIPMPSGHAAPQPPPTGLPPQFRPTQGYRPIDPATGYVPPPAFQPARNPSFTGAGPKPPTATDPRARPRMAPDSYGAEPASAEPAMRMPRYEAPAQRQPARSEALRPPTYNFDGDYQDEIFEEPAQPARRASATDYNQAYRDNDAMFEPERRRSGGPWLLLALLLLAAAAAGGGIWYYQTNVKSSTTASASGDAPVIEAPETPVKTAPADGTAADGGQSNTTAASLNKKQIYDRIVGDKEVPGGAMVPTEEAPVQPVIQEPPQPTQGSTQSAPAATDENLPLPMPPPPGTNTQGAVPLPAGNTQVSATAAPAGTEAIPQPAATDAGLGNTEVQQAAASPAAADNATAEAPAEQEAIVDEPAPVRKKPAKAQQATKAKSKAKAKAGDDVGVKPVVLVPPAAGEAATQDPTLVAEGEPPLAASGAETPAPAPVKKKKTLLGLFTGENNKVEDSQPADTQVAAVQPETQTARPAQAAKSGFVVQLSSFRSEREAKSEAQRMASKHAAIFNGLSPGVSAVSVGGSTRYRVVFGTMNSRTDASNVCQKLASSGERDCVIARR